MAEEHPNTALARRLWEATAAGDSEQLLELFTPDVLWHAYGDNPTAGEFKGAEEVFGNLAGAGETVDDLQSDLREIYASDGGAVIHYHVFAQRGPKTLDCDYLMLLRITGGRVFHVTVVPADQPQSDEFWKLQ